MNVGNSKTNTSALVRLSGIAAAALVLAGTGCTAGKGNPDPAEQVRAEDQPATDFALVSADPQVPPVADVPEDRLEALSIRAELRDFSGDPPTVPHEIEQISSADCLRCHGDSPEADEKGAPKVPHAFLANCTQCHVEDESEYLFGDELVPNTFESVAAPSGGSRAYVGAPPLVPHNTLMRSNCLSCHGTFGLTGLQTSHPARPNCLQCHGVSATMNQRMPWS
ncbi:MAG: nitrate reductase cytochrome c-type subunit [Planctomycetota bacterium]|jgi:cytochrome c-type protein NapB